VKGCCSEYGMKNCERMREIHRHVARLYIAEGRVLGRADILLKLLAWRFGTLSL
jgi:hypothetical protein